jgi:hypothetical protein
MRRVLRVVLRSLIGVVALVGVLGALALCLLFSADDHSTRISDEETARIQFWVGSDSRLMSH